jgi:hypothetical protein
MNNNLIKNIIKEDNNEIQKKEFKIPIVKNITPLKEKTFHKNNRVIKGKSSIKVSKHSHNLGNMIYREMTLRMTEDYILKDNTMKISLAEMKKTLKMTEGNYNLIIKKALEDLKNGNIELEHYTDRHGRHFEYVVMSLLNSFKKEILPNKEIVYHISVSEDMIEFLKENSGGNYTLINCKYTCELSGIKQIKLYEYCKQYITFQKGQVPKLNLEDLNTIFQSNYRYLSKAKEQIKKSMKGINGKTDVNISFIESDNKKFVRILVEENERAIKDKQQKEKRREMMGESKGNGIFILKDDLEKEEEMIEDMLKEN